MAEGEAGFRGNHTWQSGLNEGKLEPTAPAAQPPKQPHDNTTYKATSHVRSKKPACPECGSQRLWKDGLRYTCSNREATQRWLCRNCGYRFSVSEDPEHVQTIQRKPFYTDLTLPYTRQVCDCLTEESKNLEEEATRLNQAAGATSQSADVKGKIVELAWHLKKQGRTQATISIYSKYLTILLERGANLLDPESVKDVISQQEHWAASTKKQACTAYAAFCLKHGINWADPPNYEPQRKLPFIPLEKEIDALIAACGPKTGTILQTLKETGARIGEVLALKWTDIDSERFTISINNPEKNSNPRILKVSNKLICMLNALPNQNDQVFNGVLHAGVASNFRLQRKRAAQKLQNPRLKQIHFHTLRHWKATTEYAKTKNILHVMQILGHKCIQNTMLYTQLIQFESDEYHSAVAKDMSEAQKLTEAGFEYVCAHENLMLFRKPK